MAEQAIINTSTLTSIGDAIRTKTGKTDTFLPSDMPTEILAIETGSDVSGVTAAASDVRSGKKFVNSSGAVVTGTVTARTASNVTSSNNVVTIPAGIYDSQVSKTVGTAKAATTYTPGTSNQIISAGYYLTGNQTIKGDTNLVASNIKSGTSIFGITGSLQSFIEVNANTSSEIEFAPKWMKIYKPSGYNTLLFLMIRSNTQGPANGNVERVFCDNYGTLFLLSDARDNRNHWESYSGSGEAEAITVYDEYIFINLQGLSDQQFNASKSYSAHVYLSNS